MGKKMESFVRVFENDDFVVDYDRHNNKYRVSYFEDYHWVDECWFDAYEDKSLRIKKIEEDCWWCGYCPKCGKLTTYNCSEHNENRKQYCWKCGQLIEFK